MEKAMTQARDSLPDIDSKILSKAMGIAEASLREPDPTRRTVPEEFALDLWRQAHQARRDALYARGRCQ
jgi:hypothetical protein